MGLEAAKMGSEASSRVDRSFIGCWWDPLIQRLPPGSWKERMNCNSPAGVPGIRIKAQTQWSSRKNPKSIILY
jgi:hypothetical protein